MHILIIGGCPVYGYGLSARQPSFVNQFIGRLEDAGYCVQLTAYAMLPLSRLRPVLAQLPLPRYDLILIQPAHYYLQHPPSFWSLFRTPDSVLLPAPDEPCPRPSDLDALRCQPAHGVAETPAKRGRLLKRAGKLGLLQLAHALGCVRRLRYVQDELATLLAQLRAYRHRVLLLTPAPHREPISAWLRRQGRAYILHEGRKQGIAVLDTHALIRPDESFFLPGDLAHLNAVGHELLGRALFEWYQHRQTGPGYYVPGDDGRLHQPIRTYFMG